MNCFTYICKTKQIAELIEQFYDIVEDNTDFTQLQRTNVKTEICSELNKREIKNDECYIEDLKSLKIQLEINIELLQLTKFDIFHEICTQNLDNLNHKIFEFCEKEKRYIELSIRVESEYRSIFELIYCSYIEQEEIDLNDDYYDELIESLKFEEGWNSDFTEYYIESISNEIDYLNSNNEYNYIEKNVKLDHTNSSEDISNKIEYYNYYFIII